jgi:Flp pilus assembly protein TadG
MARRMAKACRGIGATIRSDRGASAVELAVLAPAFLMVIMLIIQFGLWFEARQVALAAAQAGARVAREEYFPLPDSWEQDADDAAVTYYHALNTHLLGSLTSTTVTGENNGAPVVGVTVRGPLGFSVFSWFGSTWTISETVEGPAECFHPLDQGGNC